MKNFSIKAKPQDDTGFGVNSSNNAGRFINKDGSANLHKRGISIFERYSAYHTMLLLPRWKFLAVILIFFVTINLAFATMYFCIGIQYMGGIISGTPLENFGEAFFFSTQTFTTVGYGRINPVGFLTSSIAAVEALAGLLSFAVVTGLFYGRFSRPRAYLKFSNSVLIAPYKSITALMFRMVPYKNNQLTELETKVTLAMNVEENGKNVNRFYALDLEFSKINALSLSWTIVHPVDEKSPLYNFSYEDMQKAKVELIVNVRGFDEAFSNTVVARTSYNSQEVVAGAKFKIMYDANVQGNFTVLHLDRLNDIERAALPVLQEGNGVVAAV